MELVGEGDKCGVVVCVFHLLDECLEYVVLCEILVISGVSSTRCVLCEVLFAACKVNCAKSEILFSGEGLHRHFVSSFDCKNVIYVFQFLYKVICSLG